MVRSQTNIPRGLCGLYQNTNSDRAFSETDFKSWRHKDVNCLSASEIPWWGDTQSYAFDILGKNKIYTNSELDQKLEVQIASAAELRYVIWNRTFGLCLSIIGLLWIIQTEIERT